MSAMEASLPVAGKRRNLIEGTWAFLGQICSGLILLAGTRLMTEWVPPNVFGQVALLNGLVGLGVTLFVYPFVSAGMRLLPDYLQEGRKGILLQGVDRLVGVSLFIACTLLAMGGIAYIMLRAADPWPFLTAILLLIVTVRRELGVQWLISERHQREASLWQTTDSLLRPTLALLLVWWGGAEDFLILLGYGLASTMANAMGGRYNGTTKIIPENAGLTVRRDILCYALPLIPLELLSWFNALGDRYVIGYFLTPQDVGLYAAAYTLTNEAFHRAAIVLLRTFQPVYFAHHSHGRHRRAFQTWMVWTAGVATMGLAGTTALYFLKDFVAALFLAPVYRGAADLMFVIGTGCAIQALGTVLAQPLYARKTTRRLLLGRVSGALTAAVALPWLIQGHGVMGAAWAAPLYFGVEALVMACVAKPLSAGSTSRRAA